MYRLVNDLAHAQSKSKPWRCCSREQLVIQSPVQFASMSWFTSRSSYRILTQRRLCLSRPHRYYLGLTRSPCQVKAFPLLSNWPSLANGLSSLQFSEGWLCRSASCFQTTSRLIACKQLQSMVSIPFEDGFLQFVSQSNVGYPVCLANHTCSVTLRNH